MKTKTFVFMLLGALTFLAAPLLAQETPADTSYLAEIVEGDTVCYLVLGEEKTVIDCAELPPMLPPGVDPPKDPTPEPPTDPKPPTETAEEVDESPTLFDLLKKGVDWVVENWYILILPLLEIVVRIIPGEKDNNILRMIQSWLDAIIPNRRKGGGRFVAYDDKDSAPSGRYVGDKKLPPPANTNTTTT